MADSRDLAPQATLPERYARFDVLASTIDHRGRLVTLLVDPATARRSYYDATAVICDAGTTDVYEIPLHGLDQRFTNIDAYGDGVIVGAARNLRARPDRGHYRDPVPEQDLTLTRNVHCYDSNGSQVGAFYAGDAINQLSTDPDGRIWISYSDESNYWYPNADGTRSYGFENGLARWDDSGSEPWWAWAHTPGVAWCHCYSLNVGRTIVYACPYTDFPLVEIDSTGVRAITPNPIKSCTGLAVSDSALAFLHQYRRTDTPVWKIRQARRQDGVVTETGTEILTLPGGRSPAGWARGKIGRDATLWLYEDGNPLQWYRYEIDC